MHTHRRRRNAIAMYGLEDGTLMIVDECVCRATRGVTIDGNRTTSGEWKMTHDEYGNRMPIVGSLCGCDEFFILHNTGAHGRTPVR